MFWTSSGEEEDMVMKQPKPKVKRQQAKRCNCPVCKEYLGWKEPGMEVSLHCRDCRAWFTWFPGVTKPLGKLDRDIPERCTCSSCNYRDGIED